MGLSMARAKAVRDFLVAHGPDRGPIDPQRIRVTGAGSCEPLVDRAYQPDPESNRFSTFGHARTLTCPDIPRALPPPGTAAARYTFLSVPGTTYDSKDRAFVTRPEAMASRSTRVGPSTPEFRAWNGIESEQREVASLRMHTLTIA